MFSPDSLSSDIGLRYYMDEEGYLPVSFFFRYPDIINTKAEYNDVIYKMFEVSIKARYYEFNLANQTVRHKGNWKNVSFNIFIIYIYIVFKLTLSYLIFLI